MGDVEKKLLIDAFDSNWIAPLGPNVDAFEQEIVDYLEVQNGCALSSGSAALHLALRILGVTKGDIVLCPSLTFAASANVILYENATPVFVDVDPKYWTMDISALEHAIKKYNPKALIAVDLYGQSCDYEIITDLCEKNNSLAYSINVDGTKNIIQACEKANCKIIFVSTSFVFDGLKNEYTEDDKTSPATYYGFTKWKGEEYVKVAKVPYLILRTDALYGWVEKWQRDNSVTRALKFLRAEKTLKEITDWCNTPTYLPDFVTAIIKLIKLNKTGIYHLTGSNFISRFEWSKEVADVFGLNLNNIVPVLSKELEHISVKRVNINLLNNKIKNDTGTSFKTTRQGAISMLNTDVNSY